MDLGMELAVPVRADVCTVSLRNSMKYQISIMSQLWRTMKTVELLLNVKSSLEQYCMDTFNISVIHLTDHQNFRVLGFVHRPVF
jgi:hypothetical protein